MHVLLLNRIDAVSLAGEHQLKRLRIGITATVYLIQKAATLATFSFWAGVSFAYNPTLRSESNNVSQSIRFSLFIPETLYR